MSLDGLSLSVLVTELDENLTGGRVEKIFQPDKQTLILWIRKPGENFKVFISVAAQHPRIHITKNVPDNPASPTAFCMLLRKYLEDARIGSIRQYGTDRVIILDFDFRAEQGLITTKQLIIELIGKHSNIIFASQGIIHDSIRRVTLHMSRHRQILPGKPYMPPPSQNRLDMFSDSSSAIVAQATNSHVSLSKSLINTISGMGPVTAKEIIWRAGLPAEIAASSLNNSNLTALEIAIREVSSELLSLVKQPTVLVDEHGQLAAIAAFPLHYQPNSHANSFKSMSEAIEFAADLNTMYRPPLLEELSKLIESQLHRQERKKTTLEKELEEAREASTFRHYGDLLMIYLHQIPPRATEISLPDLFAENPDEMVIIPLDPIHSPTTNAQYYYNKYNKLERRQAMTAVQLLECQHEISYLQSVAVAIDNALLPEDGEAIRKELISAAYITEKRKSRKIPAIHSETPWKFTVEGMTILIGKNNVQNDWLTFKESRPSDLWLHAKDIPGSHVIIRCGELNPSTTILTSAALCAAWFSKARNSSNVPIDYTRRRYVKKPSGSKPGFVIYENQKTIYVTPDSDAIDKLGIK